MTVRFWLVLLLFLAACPVVFVAGDIASQNAQIVADRSLQSIANIRDMARVRQQAFVAQGSALLVALGEGSISISADVAGCSNHLRTVLETAQPRYARIALVSPGGTVRCGAMLQVPQTDLTAAELVTVARADERAGVQVGPFAVAGAGGPSTGGATLSLALAVRRPDGPAASAGAAGQQSDVLLATLREDGLLDLPDLDGAKLDLSAWFVTSAGPVALLPGSRVETAPTQADLARLQVAPNRLMEGVSQSGQRYMYAISQLGPDLMLVVGEPTTAFMTHADMLLSRRLAELGLVILVGLAIVAIGADVLLGRPLKRVARMVRQWRAGGSFDPGPFRHAPAEIREMAQSFSKAVAALAGREQQLRDATVKQELLMQEIHHRVKNNLQVVASLLNLQASRIRQPAARAEFHAARDRIRALATLHRHLYAHGELHTINMRGFLDELCEQLLQAMGETPGGGRIALTIEATELQISSDQAVPIALLVTEAVSNAVKYAFPGGRSGHIAVRLAVSRDDAGRETARLSIDDDGVGIPAGRSETESGVRDGLGLRLIHGFARQLGAELEVREENGTHYAVNIVLSRERADGDAGNGDGTDEVTGKAA